MDGPLYQTLKTAQGQGRIMGKIAESLTPQIAGFHHRTADSRPLKQALFQTATLIRACTTHKIEGTAYAGGEHHTRNSFLPNLPQNTCITFRYAGRRHYFGMNDVFFFD
jgi:hypothetical protein